MTTESDSDAEHEAEFHIADLAILWGELRASSRACDPVYTKLMFATIGNRRMRRPSRYYDIGERVAKLGIEMAGIQDEIGALLNEKVAEYDE
jgi:hypothetical protein